MRTALVVTHRRCNQNCGFCTERSAVDERAFIVQHAVESRIASAVAEGAEEIVLTGGEPTLRRDLTELVAFAKQRGARVVLETNGSALDAAALFAAGVDVFRLHVPAWGAELNRITRDDSAASTIERALAAVVAIRAPLEIAAPIVRSNRAELEKLPSAIVGVVGDPRHVRTMRVALPTSSPDPAELVSYEEAAAAIVAVDAAARRVGLSVKIAAGSGLPPCVVPKRIRPTHLWSLTGHARDRIDRLRVAECEGCRVREQCGGLDRAVVQRFGKPSLEPIAEERVRRRLALIATTEEQIAREFVTFDRARDPQRGVISEEIIRVNFHCNQSCGFCFVSTHLPPPGDDAVITAIEAALSRGAKVVLSGGEPTLNARIVDYVRLGSRGGTLPLQLQTNAIRLDDEALVDELVTAGLREAFVSLHGPDAAVSDSITAAPGTFARTVVGLDNLHRAAVRVTINYVVCESNAAELPRFVDVVAKRWPRATINLSFVAPSTDVVPRDRELIPRLSQVLPHIAEALGRADVASLEVRGFESMCGVPLCLVPAKMEQLFALAELAEGVDRGEFVHADACGPCDARARCFGVRRGYVELHGLSELRPILTAR